MITLCPVCVRLIPWHVADVAGLFGCFAPEAVNVDEVLANPGGRELEKPFFLGGFEEDALALGQAVRDAAGSDPLPGGLATAEPFNVVAERVFIRGHQEIFAVGWVRAKPRDRRRDGAPSGRENGKAERLEFADLALVVNAGQQLKAAASRSRPFKRWAVMMVVTGINHRGPGPVTVKASGLA